MNKPALIAIGIMVLIPLGLLVWWSVQGNAMRDSFVQALRTGKVTVSHRDLLGKKWTAEELASVEVIKVPDGAGRERAIARAVHSRNRIVISSFLYAYQGTICDNSTGIVHVFGVHRSTPGRWTWAAIHPSSGQRHLERHLKQFEDMKRRATEGASEKR